MGIILMRQKDFNLCKSKSNKVANMNQTHPSESTAKFIVKDNILALISNTNLTTLSSGIFNGGFKKVKAVLNVSVPDNYSDQHLHDDPMNLIYDAKKKLAITTDYVAMITAAKIQNMSTLTKQKNNVKITVVATAGWRHGESSGEEIEASHAPGTINVIVLLDGNPTDSCLVSLFLTATEAKTAAMNDYDIRSRYTGDAATGTITDSLSVATTGVGQEIQLGGPASEIGQLVASAVRQVVKEAANKQEGQHEARSLSRRLAEHHLSIEKLVFELAKRKAFGDEKTLQTKLENILSTNQLASAFLFAAVKMDQEYKKGLIPKEFGDIDVLSKNFGKLISKADRPQEAEYLKVDLPPFTRQALFNILQIT